MLLRFCLTLCLVALAGCTGHKALEDVSVTPKLQRSSYSDLPGWQQDNLSQSFQAFLKSCDKILKAPADKPFRPAGTYGDFHSACHAAASLAASNDQQSLRNFFEQRFTPYKITELETGKANGLFTGYYEASLKGSLKRHGPYQTPLYGLPDDMVTADLGLWYDELKGKTITAQVKDGKLVRYPSREQIVRDGLSRAEVIVWIDDPIDAFFLEIQGSGVVTLDDGRQMRVGYAGKNGHAYYAVGRKLIEEGALNKENVSLQTIRDWMRKNPQRAQQLMNTNPSYVFFKKQDASGAIGAQNVVLTPTRSLAIDRHLYDYGIPIWLHAKHPKSGNNDIRQLMVAQDTGGAIKGVVRGDFFWGYGAYAEDNAGEMKSDGSYWFLLPKTISVK